MKKINKELRKDLQKHACYVLITCDPPAEDGDMQVEMCYQGDSVLAAYLLKGAQSFLENQENETPNF